MRVISMSAPSGNGRRDCGGRNPSGRARFAKKPKAAFEPRDISAAHTAMEGEEAKPQECSSFKFRLAKSWLVKLPIGMPGGWIKAAGDAG